jgi:tetratricopeptide (TPR) repeat protein
MSLVNEMLNELQKEKQSVPNFDGLIAIEDTSTGRYFNPKLISFLFLLLTIVVALYVFFYSTAELADPQRKSLADNSLEDQTHIADNPIQSATSTQNIVKENFVKDAPIKNKSLNENYSVTEVTAKKLAPVKTVIKNKLLKANSADIPKTHQTNDITKTKKIQKLVTKAKQSKDQQATKVATANHSDKTRSVIKISRASLADKQLRVIQQQWNNRSLTENKNSIDSFLAEFADLDIAWLKAIKLVKQESFSFSQTLLDQAIQKFPNQPSIRMLLVKDKIAQQDYQTALLELKAIDSKFWQLSQYKIAGFLAQKIGDHVAAIRFYNQLLKSKPNQGDINMAIAISLEAINESDLAVAKFQRALEDASLKPIQRQFIAQRIAVLQG